MSTHPNRILQVSLLSAAFALLATPARAQHGGHEGHVMPARTQAMPASRPAAKPPAAESAARRRDSPPSTPAAVDHAAMGHGTSAPAAASPEVDHAAMGHGASEPEAGKATQPVRMDHDHAAMGHGGARVVPAVDHASMGHGAASATAPTDHDGMDHSGMGHGAAADLPADAPPRTPIPALTDADRAAAFPPALHGHEVHDQRPQSYWLVDRLEWQDTEEGSLGWEGVAWIGGDIHRLWLRTEGEASDRDVESATAEVLYGRAISPWWDAVGGVRHDFGHGPSRTYAAFGVQGLAPYKFEVEATAFIGAGGRGGATLEAEYDTLVTNRLILQWQAEANLYFKDDAATGVGSGLSTIEAGARLRYEITRRVAPYIGVEWERAFGRTADLRRGGDEPINDTRLVAGLRFWF